MTRLVWFRTDLRVHDHPALTHSRRDDDATTLAVTFVTEPQWRQHDLGDRRINLIRQGIAALDDALNELNIPLLVIPLASFADCESKLIELVAAFDVQELNFNIEYEVNERHRDIRLVKALSDITINRFHDQCLVPPGELTTQNGDPYRVYSPFRKAWLKRMDHQVSTPLPKPDAQPDSLLSSELKTHWLSEHQRPTFDTDELWDATETAAHDRLKAFIDNDALHYDQRRDLPDLDATSRLSFYLAMGILSPRQCIYSAWQHNVCQLIGGEAGLDSWINELVWREFYRHLIVAYPELCKHKAFRKDYQNIPWRDSESDFKRWCDGETGYPIVDAAMKQLAETGWMHNRLRMITAMFLTKHLLIDWHWGEKFFSQNLVDADLAANNGGWQWSASTGADGAPYFRIFNPITQSEKFDKQGLFLARYLPELRGLAVKDRHFPTPIMREHVGYPSPIVEHKTARERALTTFKNMET
ncbi:MAG: deoxyribodipyrimidine photo-lyase [Pseudomonas sp.]|nr:deoxyribodipyrimidine photo-lyase [Pseudomonas sp.]